jgi:DNA-binding GntR family transcriptional regulator
VHPTLQIEIQSLPCGGTPALKLLPELLAGPLRRTSLREEVVEALRDDLATGRLAGGTSLTVGGTAERFGVSATPVREALIHLAAHGLLTGGHNKGYQVPEYTWTDFLEIIEARRLIGVPLAGRIARTAPAESLQPLFELAERLDTDSFSGEHIAETTVIDRRFFAALADLGGNGRLAGILETLRIQGWMYVAAHLRDAGEVTSGWHRYREMVECIAERRADDAMALWRDYASSSREAARVLTGS